MADVANSQPDLHKSTQEEGSAVTNKKDEKIVEKAQQNTNNEQNNQVIDEDLYDQNGNFDHVVARAKSFKSFQINEQGLRCPQLENHVLFKKLKKKVIKFFIEEERYRVQGPSVELQEIQLRLGLDFEFMKKLHYCLKKMLHEVINSDDKQNQEYYLKRTYEWFIKQSAAVGLIGKEQIEKEDDLMNPDKVKARFEEKEKLIEEKQMELLDEIRRDKEMREMFHMEERTEILGILPAKDRIKNYKVKALRKNLPSALPLKAGFLQSRIAGVKSTTNLQAKLRPKGEERPVTAGMVSTFGISEAQTNITSNNFLESASRSIAASNARAISLSRFSKFEENDKQVKKFPFNAFYTSNEPTAYHMENRFEGRSNYMGYYPTGMVYEQELEKFWINCQNKDLQDKRRDEEKREMMKEWGHARGRVESEIARKKEHLNVATNFKEARGWVRQNWKSKNHKHEQETMEDFLQISKDSEDEIDKSEIEIQVQREDIQAQRITSRQTNSSIKPVSKTISESVHLNQNLTKTKSQNAPLFVDLTQIADDYGFRPSTAIQKEQLSSIFEHNEKLPARKKKKESLPLLSAANTYQKTLFLRDPKTKKIGHTEKFYNVGLVDDCNSMVPDHLRGTKDAFSLENKMRELQMRQSKQKIRNLRQYFGNLIGSQIQNHERAENPFIGLSGSQLTQQSMSLSVYNKPEQLSRPKTAVFTKFNIFKGDKTDMDPVRIAKGVKGLEPTIQLDAEGNPMPVPDQPIPDPRIAEMQIPSDLQMLARTELEQQRLKAFVECQSIKEKLARVGCTLPMSVIERAVMIPDEMEQIPAEKQYPNPKDCLMENPFPKPKKKKKGKGKKKK